MTKPRAHPDLARNIRDLIRRVGILERSRSGVITPVSTAAATINQTSYQTPYMALVNPLGASLTWWIWVAPTVGTTVTMQLRADDGTVGLPNTAPNMEPSLVAVSLTVPADWQPGLQHMIYLDALIDVNTATVVPVRALIN